VVRGVRQLAGSHRRLGVSLRWVIRRAEIKRPINILCAVAMLAGGD